MWVFAGKDLKFRYHSYSNYTEFLKTKGFRVACTSSSAIAICCSIMYSPCPLTTNTLDFPVQSQATGMYRRKTKNDPSHSTGMERRKTKNDPLHSITSYEQESKRAKLELKLRNPTPWYGPNDSTLLRRLNCNVKCVHTNMSYEGASYSIRGSYVT